MPEVYVIRDFANAGNSVPPARCQLGLDQVACMTERPDGGGPLCILHFFTGDGSEVAGPYDLRQFLPDLGDAAFGTPFVSGRDGKLKGFITYLPQGGGSRRRVAIIDTGVTAL